MRGPEPGSPVRLYTTGIAGAEIFRVSNIVRRTAAAAVTGITGVAALAAALTGAPQALAGGAGGASAASLRAQTDLARSAVVVEDVTAHGRTAEGYEGDEAPTGVDVHEQVSTADVIEAADTVADPAAAAGIGSRISTGCSDDGTSGNRVQAVYVVANDRPDRYNEVVNALKSYSAGVDAVFLASAAESGGRRQIRWVHDASCQPVVSHAVVAPADTVSFGSLQAALKAQGYSRGDRKYLLYTDAAVLCGVANVYTDTTPLQSNANNGGWAQYARVDAPCWQVGDHSVEAHELTHTLGAVLSFAPHASAAGHCTDESDVMCYSDGNGVVMTQSCPTTHEKLLDCHGDDYFNTNPAPGSALATNWNSANSSFLYDPPAPVIAAGTFDAGSSTVSVQPQVLSGQGWRIDWTGAGCTVGSARTDSASASAASVPISCAVAGTVTATLTQQDGRSVSATVPTTATPPVPSAPTAPAAPAPAAPAPTVPTAPTAAVSLTASAAPTGVRSGGRAVISGTATVNGAPAARQRIDLQRKVGLSWGRVATAWSSTLGTVSFPQTVQASTTFRLVTTGNPVATSRTVTVTVSTPAVRLRTSGLKVRGTVSPAKSGTQVRLLQADKLVASARTDARGGFTLTAPRAGTRYSVAVGSSRVAVSTPVSRPAAARR